MSIRVALIIILLLSCAAGSELNAQERRSVPPALELGAASDDLRSNIAQLIENYRQAWQQLDADGLARLHTKDVEWINAYARLFRGRDALQTFLKERLFPEFERALNDHNPIVLNSVSTRYLNASAAVVHLYTDFQLGESAPRRTHFHLVLANTGGEWQIAHSAIMDALP